MCKAMQSCYEPFLCLPLVPLFLLVNDPDAHLPDMSWKQCLHRRVSTTQNCAATSFAQKAENESFAFKTS